MSRKSAHPDLRLFDYLSGALDESAARDVSQHIEGCKDCATLVDVVSAMKSEASDQHPDAGELERFYYGRPRADSRKIAAHVAVCRDCADDLAEYARAERAAADYNPPRDASGEIPAASWEMIRAWEESSLAKPKSLTSAASQEVFANLAELLSSRKDELREMAREQIARDAEKALPEKLELVPVIIVDREGPFRGVEMFQKADDPRGASVLKQVEKTNRFDKKPFQAFLDFGEKSYVVISDLVRRDTVRLQHVTHPDRVLRDADYFIIEE